MSVLLVLFTILFICIAFISNQPQTLTNNPFFAYFFLEAKFVISNFLVYISGFIILTFLVYRHIHYYKKHPAIIKYLFAILPVFASFVLGFLLSFILLIGIAIIQLNILAGVINTDPKLAGVQTNIDTIAHTLISTNHTPEIIPSNTDQNKELLAVANAITGKDNFYGSFLLSSIPKYFIIPINEPDASMLFIDNSLIITKINLNDLQTISPFIGNLFLRQYFSARHIKSYPNVTIMDKQEFIKFREADSNKTIGIINDNIKKVEANISSVSGAIQNDKKNITDTQNALKIANPQRATEYKNCLTAGTTHNGIFVSEHTKQYCDDLLTQLKKAETQDTAKINNLNQKMQTSQNQLQVYKYYDASFKAQKKLLQIQKQNIPHEFGIFIPTDSIKIALDSTNPNGLADYFETLTHEYLHYASDVPDKQFADSFFEEGLTEYFARMAIKDALNTSTNRGYPIQIKIITEMTNIIPESELADIYFAKDQDRLEATLARVYGDNFYKKNQLIFEALQYTTDPSLELNLANKIMKQIGGNPLKEKDLFSTDSKLQ